MINEERTREKPNRRISHVVRRCVKRDKYISREKEKAKECETGDEREKEEGKVTEI